jgi:phage baseplate assembly protein W
MAKKYIYRDINLDFEKHPLTRDVVTATDVEAIKKSLRNLIMIDFFEVPFDPDKGTSLKGSLFENFTPMTTEFLKSKIKEMVERYEPRIEIRKIVIFQKDDLNALEVTIYFKILDLNQLQEMSFFVERTR